MDILRFIEVCDGLITRQDALQRLPSSEAYEAIKEQGPCVMAYWR